MTTQIIIFIIVMLGYAVAHVAKKLQEQAEIKRAREEAHRRHLESLRTGRVEDTTAAGAPAAPRQPEPVSHQEATQRLKELAERRREQLEELRRRAMGQARTPSAPSAPPVAPPRPAPARAAPVPRQRPQQAPRSVPQQGDTSPRPIDRPAPVQKSRQSPAQRPAAREQGRGPRPAPAQRSRPVEAERTTETVIAERAAAYRAADAQAAADEAMRPAAPATPARAALGKLLVAGAKPGLAEWRRAMMLRELLSPPVAMRDEQTGM